MDSSDRIKSNPISHIELKKQQLPAIFNVDTDKITSMLSELNINKDDLNFSDIQRVGHSLYSNVDETEVLGITNNKGGVGKTFVSFELSQFLQLEGKRVLAVDLDGQCNLTNFFMNYEPEHSVVDWFSEEGETRIESLAIDVDNNLSILPANEDLGNFSAVLDRAFSFDSKKGRFSSDSDLSLLNGVIDSFKRYASHFDYVVIDSPPNLGVLNVLACAISTKLITPISPERNNKEAAEVILGFSKYVDKLLGRKSDTSKYFLLNNVRPLKERIQRDGEEAIRKTIERADSFNESSFLMRAKIPFSQVFGISNSEGISISQIGTFGDELEEDEVKMIRSLVGKFREVLDELQDSSSKRASTSKSSQKRRTVIW